MSARTIVDSLRAHFDALEAQGDAAAVAEAEQIRDLLRPILVQRAGKVYAACESCGSTRLDDDSAAADAAFDAAFPT